nr:carboxypeptidase regulatory-like domain-containing protein [Kofleriaceae bacterium]
ALQLTLIRDGKERALGRCNSGDVFPLPRAAIGGAGAISIKATFAGDSLRQPAVAEAGLDLRVGSTTTLAIDGATRNLARAFEDSLTAQGNVMDDDGGPAVAAAIGLYAGDKRIDQTATDRNGKFRIVFEAKLLGTGQFGITARAEKSAARDGSVSAPVVVAIATPQPVPVRYTLMTFAATAVAALVFFALRRRRAPKPKLNSDEQPRPATEIAGGITAAKPGFAATLRRAGDTMFLGQVREAWRMRPLAAAVVELTLGDQRREFVTDGSGRFEFEDLPPGPWQATIKAAGHIAEHVGVTIPHRGELRGVAIDLLPVRERVFHLYRRAAEPLLPKPALWGVWSPRQIVDHVRSRRPSPALTELTNLVEEVYFSPRLAEEAILALTSSRVEAAMLERGRPG